MDLQLLRLRKAAGYSNRDDFARAHGIKLSTYKSYETGRIKLTLDKACELANIFGCTLDDLAGRKPPYDRQKAMLIRDLSTHIRYPGYPLKIFIFNRDTMGHET